MLRAWMQDSPAPSTHYLEWPGRWVTEDTWPSSNIQQQTLFLSDRTLDAQPHGAQSHSHCISSVQQCGMNAGTCARMASRCMGDQRMDDGWSSCFDGAPATEPMTRWLPGVDADVERGQTAGTNRSAVVRRVAKWFVATGELGIAQFTHRDSHEQLEPMPVYTPAMVKVKLNAMGHQLPVVTTGVWQSRQRIGRTCGPRPAR